jgi:hypothetical protein
MFETLATVLASSGAGSIIGGIFGLLGRKEERKAREADYKFKLESMRLGGDIAIETTDAQAFLESQKTISKFGGAVKSAVRPIITGFLLWQCYVILTSLESITGGLESLPADITLELYRDIVLNIISLTATAVNWWFAARGTSKK